MLRTIIFFLFFISGFTGLLYEIVWVRIFGLIFGNTTLAISTVLSAFMVGLALGSLMLGRVADRIKNHLRFYAVLEIGIAISAILVLFLRMVIDPFFSFLYSFLNNLPFLFYIIKFLISFLVMLPATFLMGGTLPVISRAIISEKDRLGYGISLLYGVNTLGAVLGVLLTGFFFIRAFGVNNSVFLAVGLDGIIAVAAFLLSPRTAVHPSFFSRKEKFSLPSRDKFTRYIALLMGVSGFAALAYEILWSRVLVFVFTNSVYAFAIMLTTFLLGIALGSMVASRMVDSIRRPVFFLGMVEIGIALTALVAGALLMNFTSLHTLLFAPDPQTTWFQWNLIRFFEAFLVMFLPTFFMGISFPVAGKIVVPRVSQLGEELGYLYAFNTFGGMLGSFLTGFVFIVLFGTAATIILMVGLNLLIGLLLVFSGNNRLPTVRSLAFTGAGAAVIVLLVVVVPKTVFSRVYNLVETHYPLIDFREGVEGTVTVHQGNLPLSRNKRIDVDGLNVAGTSFMLRTLQVLQGHLPNLVHGPAQDVLQIGFGTGQTSHSALLYPIRNFTLVEISRDVMELSAKHFREINRGVLENPRFHYRISDGKNFVKYTPEKYDIIMNDANYAVATASASLFTRDHFENCCKKLKPGGILSTWMTTDLDPEDFRIVLRTFQSVFPYAMLWMAPNCINKQVVLMGSLQPLKIDVRWVEKNLQNPEIQKDLVAMNIQSLQDVISCIVLDSRGIRAISEGTPLNTDNRPVLEYSTKAIRARDLCAYQNLAKILHHRPDVEGMLSGLPEQPVQKQNFLKKMRQYLPASRQLFIGMLQFYQGNSQRAMETLLSGSRLIPQSRLAAQFFRDMDIELADISYQAQQNPGAIAPKLKLARYYLSRKQNQKAEEVLQNLLDRDVQSPLVFYEMARCQQQQSCLESAKMYLKKALGMNPRFSAARYLRGVILRKEKKYEPAIEAFRETLQLDSRIYEAHNAIGGIEMARGNLRAARSEFVKSLRVVEFQPEIVANLAECDFLLKNYQPAQREYQTAIDMGYANADVFFKLANTFYMQRQFSRAEKNFRRAVEFDSTNAEYFYNLGNVLAVQQKFSEAIHVYRRAIRLDERQPDYYNNLGLCYREMGNVRQAQLVFQEGLRKNPTSEQLRKRIAELNTIP